MRQLTVPQRVFIVKTYFETKSYVDVRRLFAEQFPERMPPTKKNIKKNVDKYLNHGTSCNRNKGNSGRPRTGHSQDNIDAVQNELVNNPTNMSCRINNLDLAPCDV